MSKKFAMQLANSLIMSKINYHLEIWGLISYTNRRKIDNILTKTAKLVIGKEGLGRTEKWLLNQMKWLNIENGYKISISKYIHKIINGKEEHIFKNYMTENRSRKNQKQLKLGPHKPEIGKSHYTQKTFLYQAIDICNNLPKNITLIRENNIFKKWIKRYFLDANTTLKERKENEIEDKMITVDNQKINECENHES